jgi:hypothetical protein
MQLTDLGFSELRELIEARIARCGKRSTRRCCQACGQIWVALRHRDQPSFGVSPNA